MSIHDILSIVAALAVVVVMILLIRYGTRVVGIVPRRNHANGGLSLDASLSLDPRRRINLIGCQGRQLLLLTGGPVDIFIGWLQPPGPSAGDRS